MRLLNYFSFQNNGPLNLSVFLFFSLGGNLTGHACPYVPDVFFFSVILFFGTFAAASSLKKFKFTPFFPTKVSKSRHPSPLCKCNPFEPDEQAMAFIHSHKEVDRVLISIALRRAHCSWPMRKTKNIVHENG